MAAELPRYDSDTVCRSYSHTRKRGGNIHYQEFKNMKQILQHLKRTTKELAEVPCPQVGRGQVLIQTKASLISAGTEKMLIEFSEGNFTQKAWLQPDRIKQVLDKNKLHMDPYRRKPTINEAMRKPKKKTIFTRVLG